MKDLMKWLTRWMKAPVTMRVAGVEENVQGRVHRQRRATALPGRQLQTTAETEGTAKARAQQQYVQSMSPIPPV
jgi:hypothetical protein